MARPARWAFTGVVLSLATLTPAALRAQDDVFELRDRCAATDSTLGPPCLEAALAAQATQGAVGLALAGGSDNPGTPSTLGRRLGTTPRVALSLRVGGAWSDAPDVARSADLPVREEGFFAGSLEGRAAVGVFQGFSPVPTVGGILSLDLVGTAGVTFLSSGFGFHGNPGSLGIGARVGLLRESFTLPGVSVSAVRHWIGRVRLGRLDQSDRGTRVDVEPRITSIRAVAGKDLMAVGLIAGMGWDRYSGAARVRVGRSGAAGPADVRVDDFHSDRVLYFGGLSVTYLVLQVSAEAGWTGGYFELPDRTGGLYDPSGGSFFGSVALRLTI